MSEPTREMWQRLFELAAEVKSLAPWEWMDETQVFGVRNPETDQLGFVSVMGRLGDHFAIALYLGAEGLYGLWAMEELGEDLSAEVLLSIPQLQLSFEDRDTLSQYDRELIKSLGLRFRGRNAWPMFRSYRPGFMPWHLEADEAYFLTLALEQALDVLPRVRENPTLLDSREESIDYLVRVARRHAQGWIWKDQIIQVPPPEPHSITLRIDPVALKQLKQLPLTNATFEIDLSLMNSQIQEKPNDRPKQAFILLVVDHDSGMVLNGQVLVADPDMDAMWASMPVHILRVLSNHQIVPRRILGRNQVMLEILSLLAQELHFELYQAERLPMLERVRSFLFDRF